MDRSTRLCALRKHIGTLATAVFLAFGICTAVAYAAYQDTSSALSAKFAQLEKQYQLPSGYLAALANAESSMNATAGSPGSAYGLFQWMPKSWVDWTKQIYGTPKDLSLRANPFIAAEVTAARARSALVKFQSVITQAKLDTKLALRAEHFFGEGDFAKFMQGYIQNPKGNAAAVVSKAARANPNIFNGGSATFIDVLNNLAKRFSSSGVSVSGYTQTFIDASQNGRILDTQSAQDIQNNYTGGALPADPYGASSPADYGLSQSTAAPVSSGGTASGGSQSSGSTLQQQANTCTPRYFCSGSSVVMQDTSCVTRTVQSCAQSQSCQSGVCIAANASSQQTLSPFSYLTNTLSSAATPTTSTSTLTSELFAALQGVDQSKNTPVISVSPTSIMYALGGNTVVALQPQASLPRSSTAATQVSNGIVTLVQGSVQQSYMLPAQAGTFASDPSQETVGASTPEFFVNLFSVVRQTLALLSSFILKK